jgi:hypothetical protein
MRPNRVELAGFVFLGFLIGLIAGASMVEMNTQTVASAVCAERGFPRGEWDGERVVCWKHEGAK